MEKFLGCIFMGFAVQAWIMGIIAMLGGVMEFLRRFFGAQPIPDLEPWLWISVGIGVFACSYLLGYLANKLVGEYL